MYSFYFVYSFSLFKLHIILEANIIFNYSLNFDNFLIEKRKIQKI